MSAAVAMLLVQVLVVARVGFDGGSLCDGVVVMMESWLLGAWAGPQVVGLGGCAPTVRESVGLQSAAGAQGCSHQHNRQNQHHQHQHHHHRTSRRLGEFSVPQNSGVNSVCAARRRRMLGSPGTAEVFLFVFPVVNLFGINGGCAPRDEGASAEGDAEAAAERVAIEEAAVVAAMDAGALPCGVECGLVCAVACDLVRGVVCGVLCGVVCGMVCDVWCGVG